MTELELYKFINNNDIEWHYHNNDGDDDVIFFINFYQFNDFVKLFESSFFDEEGYDVTMKDGYFAIWARYICEYYGIVLKNVFPPEDEP